MTNISRRALLGTLCLAGVMTACGKATEPQPTPTPTPVHTPDPTMHELIIGLTYVPNIQFAPMYVAQTKGWFHQEGVNVTLRHHGAQENLLGAIQTGNEHVVFAGAAEMMQGRSQGIAIRDFATMYQQYPIAIIVPKDSPITTLHDLRGKKVGLPGEFGENWFYLLACMNLAELTREDLSIESIGFTQVAALIGGKVDAVVGYVNNDLVQLEQAGFEARTLRLDNPPLIGIGLGALDPTIASRKDDLAATLRALKRAAEFCAEDPEETVTIAEQYVDSLSDPEQRANALATLKATMPLYLGDFGAQDPERWEAMAKFMATHKLLEQKVDASDVFTTEIPVK